MNTSRNNRSKRKKAIPLYFQKSHSSLSDILQTASYKRRIKELLKNNKSLAVTLQDARYRSAKQQKEIEEYARTTTQISHAQLKLKDMASTIQKLVSDLDEVRGFLDVNSFNLMKNIDSSDHRLRIQVPDQSTIDESASKSILEADASAAEDLTENTSLSAAAHVSSPVSRDESMTEIYDHHTSLARVDSVIKSCLTKLQEDKNVKNQMTDNSASISIQSPSKQLEISKNKLPGKLEAFLQNYKESPRKPLQALNSIPFVKNMANTFVSKIPKVFKTQPPPQQDENSLPAELPDNAAHRRETFVVKKLCSIPEVFTSSVDRRGTFTINKLSEDNKCQSDRRETYLVPPESVPPIQEEPVPPIQEEPVPTNNFVEPAFSTENAISNKTILFCEDMELTEIIPTRKQWSEEAEMDKEIPCEKNKETVSPLADEDVEFTEIVPVLELPWLKPQFQDKIIDKGYVVLDKNASPKEIAPIVPAMGSPFDDYCFVKPFTPKSSNTPLSSLSNSAAAAPLQQNQIQGSGSKSNSEEDQRKEPSRKSSTKRKKSHDEQTDSATKETLKGRASSMSKRKSLAHKGNGKVSDVKPKATHRKSIARTSLKKPVLPKDFEVDFCSDIDDELPLDTSLPNSSSPCKRRTRNKSSVTDENVFDDTSFPSVPEPVNKNVHIGRKVIDFFETRQSLLPNKRTFIFTNTSKKVNTESTSTAQDTDSNSPEIELAKQDKGVFDFSASDSESSNSNNKPKKAKKRTKKSNSATHSKGKKESSNKRPRSEKVSQQQTEKQGNGVVDVQNKNDSGQKKSNSTSKSEKLTFKSTSSETTDDSFVIEEKMDENVKMKELVNSKGDRIFSKFSKPNHKTLSRNCKRPSVENVNDKACLSPTENTPNMESNVCYKDVYDPSPSELTSPPIVQDKDKGSSLNKCSPIAESEVSGKDFCEGPSSKSSKVSEGKGKAKRVFSGVSERRSKKKSPLHPPGFLEEFNSPTILEEALPKTTWLNSTVLDLDCEMTEVYNCRDFIPAKVQENNSKNKEKVSDENRVQQDRASTEKPETLQILKAKDACTDAGFIAPALSKSKKPIKVSNKVKVAAVEQNKNDKNSTKAALPIMDSITSPSNNGKKTLTVANHEQVTKEKKMKHVESIISKGVQNTSPKDELCRKETTAPPLHSNKHEKASKDSNQEQVTVATEKLREDTTKKLKVTKNVKSKPASSHEDAHVPSLGTDKSNSSTQNKVSMPYFKTTHLDDLTNNDFVSLTTKKLINIKKDAKNKEGGVPKREKHPKSKKPRREKPDSEELKAEFKVPALVEADLDSRSSKDTQNFEEVFPASASDSIPIHRQNCSGSIDSLCNVDSKGNEGRPSRRNKQTKSYAEPKLNVSSHIFRISPLEGDPFICQRILCGYVLRPKCMFDDKFDPYERNTLHGVKPITLSIQIISSRYLMKTSKGITSPFIEAELVGCEYDCYRFKSSPKEDNVLNPVLKESFTWTVNNPELAIIKFVVQYEDMFSDPKFLAQAAYPVSCLRPGYRSIALKNKYCEPLELSSLLVHIDIKEQSQKSSDQSRELTVTEEEQEQRSVDET